MKYGKGGEEWNQTSGFHISSYSEVGRSVEGLGSGIVRVGLNFLFMEEQ